MRHIKESGFTMIEIMLVIIIIGLLSAMVLPNLSGKGKQARETTVKIDIETNISMALDLYEMENGMYPSTQQGLRALFEEPFSEPLPTSWNGPYLKKRKEPLDPWGKKYVYISPGIHNTNSYDLASLGQDGIESQDDITNW